MASVYYEMFSLSEYSFKAYCEVKRRAQKCLRDFFFFEKKLIKENHFSSDESKFDCQVGLTIDFFDSGFYYCRIVQRCS